MKKYHTVLILCIFLIGTLLRFTNLNWDSYQALHPDERNIAWAVTRIHFFDQMNPKFFAYGGLPIYLYRAIGEGAAAITKNPDWLTNWGHINVLGRAVSATLSSVSLLLAYDVGVLYFGTGVGLLSAFLLAFSPWAIREAHFDTTETMLVFFLLLLLKISYSFFKAKNFKNIIICAALSGTVWGLTIGAKTTSLLFGVIPFSALWLSNPVILNEVKDPARKRGKVASLDSSGFALRMTLIQPLIKKILGTFVLGLTALGFFLLTSPFTVLDWNDFFTSMRYESGVALGLFSVPYTLQFLGTVPYLYQFQTMIWQAGVVAVLGVIGIIIIIFRPVINFIKRSRAYRKNSFTDSFVVHRPQRLAGIVIFLSFPLVYGLWVGGWYAKFARYNVPFLPFVTIAAAWLLILIIPKKLSFNAFNICRICLFVGFVGLTVLWGLANWTIYLRPETEITASKWIYANIPSNSLIFTEHWNDGLPLGLPDEPQINYNRELLTVYDTDNAAKLHYYANNLPRGQFIVLSTRRIWATMPNLQKLYPLTSKFYNQLLKEKLGYREVATFTNYPQLFGITINDDSAEESLQVFDHPTVRIFQNIKHLTATETRHRLEQE